MENLELLIEIGIFVGSLVMGFLLARLSEAAFNLLFHLRLFVVYLSVKKKNLLHEKDNLYFKEFNKMRLMDGLEALSFEEYESHFIDGKFYF